MTVKELGLPTRVAYKDVQTRTINVGGTPFAYRRLGPETGVPVVFLHHLTAVMDDWDPRVVDGIAAKQPVITFDNRGVGSTKGSTPSTVEPMARDAVAFIRALGLTQVDLFGFSLGGFLAQLIAQQEPKLVRRVILAGTGPAGGVGIDKVTSGAIMGTMKGAFTFKDPKHYLFFTKTANGKASAKAYVARLKERTQNRGKKASQLTVLAQLKAVHAWGVQKPQDLSTIRQPVLVANGEQDVMVPTSNTYDLAKRLPNAKVKIYPDAGHGGVFQYHEDFVREALAFLN
jgi:pimeloyl-ACP methyl ester carboxylesterase